MKLCANASCSRLLIGATIYDITHDILCIPKRCKRSFHAQLRWKTCKSCMALFFVEEANLSISTQLNKLLLIYISFFVTFQMCA